MSGGLSMRAKLHLTGPGLYDDNALISIDTLCEQLEDFYGLEFALLNENTIDCEVPSIGDAEVILELVLNTADVHTIDRYMKSIEVSFNKVEFDKD